MTNLFPTLELKMTGREQESNLEKVRNIMEEVVHDLESHLNLYKNHVVYLKRTLNRERQEAEASIEAIHTNLAEMKENNEKMIEERNSLKEKIEADDKDIKTSDAENQELLSQIKAQEIQNSALKDVLSDKKSKLDTIKRKLEMIKLKNRSKHEEMKKKMNFFRTALGFNIVPLKNEIIRIVFDKLCVDENIECFVTIDLAKDVPVIEIFPQIYSLERINYIFREYNNFHHFLKTIRKDFVKEYSKVN